MRISVTNWIGKKVVFSDVLRNDTVRDLMIRIHLEDGIPPDQQRLIFKGHQLQEHNKTMEDLRVEEGGQFHLVIRLRGGARTKRTARRFYLYDPPAAPSA
jgi:adenylate cyclase class IV